MIIINFNLDPMFISHKNTHFPIDKKMDLLSSPKKSLCENKPYFSNKSIPWCQIFS